MRFLYVFPHPDDESFGPVPAIAAQLRQGHEVYLLTLTRGEATSQRAKYGYSKEVMGRVRSDEMACVAETVGLTDLTILDFPDGALDALDALDLEAALTAHLAAVQPGVLVTYAVHGISGHADHLVTHALVKRVFCARRAAGGPAPQRLAFFTLPKRDDAPDTDRPEHLKGSSKEAIDCVVPFTDDDLAQGHAALRCYETYQDVVEAHRPLDSVAGGVCFELFQESFDPPLDDLTAQLGA